ncbi:MAG: phage portal protein, partial [Proteobacteria bacterium]|nr:phage portal protein [Pseudomonadota bacterium]
VEYDSGTGSIVAFHLEDDGYGKSRRIPADQVVFGFHRQRPGQLRGITPFAAATMIAQDAIGEELSSMGNKRSVRATFRIATQAF